MANRRRYDSELQMFVEDERPLNLNHLAFLRYLGETDRLEHPVAGPVGGPLVQQAVEEIARRSPDYTGKAA